MSASNSIGIIRTLIVDDSAFARKAVSEMLSRSPHIDVVGLARNGMDALELTESLRPDVVTCDLTMPELDGVGYVRQQMARRPVPILILTASPQDGEKALEALEAGAVDFVQKPTALANTQLHSVREELVEKVKAAASTRRAFTPHETPRHPKVVKQAAKGEARVDIVVLGISTGGPQALRILVPQLPVDFPVPLVIVLHMPVGYTAMFAEKLAEISRLAVREGLQDCALKKGEALIAPAGQHLSFRRHGQNEVRVHLSDQPTDKTHCPSVDVLFQSAAEVFGDRVLAIVMTGMGDDGKEGAAWIKSRGGTVLTEAEESCVIYGMPRSVAESGLSDQAVSLADMAGEIMKRI